MIGLRVPNGPSTSTVLGSSIDPIPFFCGGGSRIRRLTSAGKDNGAPPILDRHIGVTEKDLIR